MKLNADRSCTAFIDGKCCIYDVRPDVCKMYPYYFDPFAGIVVDKNCMHCEHFCKKGLTPDFFDILKRRIKFFNAENDKKNIGK